MVDGADTLCPEGLLVPIGQQGCKGKNHSGSWEKGEEEREMYILTVVSGSVFLRDCK